MSDTTSFTFHICQNNQDHFTVSILKSEMIPVINECLEDLLQKRTERRVTNFLALMNEKSER